MRTRLRTASLAALACVAAAAAPGLASPTGDYGPGYISTSNVDHVMTLPLDTDSIGARVLPDGDFVLRTAKGITLYSTENPEMPTPKGFVAVPATPNQEREDIDGSVGRGILVTGQAYDGTLYVIDISNRTAPTIKSVLQGGADHTNTCVLDCTWVYGSEGTIVDLRDPAAPKIAKRAPGWFGGGSDAQLNGVRESHDLTEVAPGLLITASSPVLWLDAREDPAEPKVIARGDLPAGDLRFMHGVEWPNGGKDRFLLGGSETIDELCQDRDLPGTFAVWDTAEAQEVFAEPGFEADGEFPLALEYQGDFRIQQGLPTDRKGQFPASQHCGHWFDAHPEFKDGGLVAMAWYTYGTRFLEVLADGSVVERGFWQPLPGISSAAFWVSEDVVWVTDYSARGIDVLRFDADAPAEVDAVSPGQFLRNGSPEAAQAVANLEDATRGSTHALDHHAGQSVEAITQAWVCKPVGAPAPSGKPVLAGTLLSG
jgi:hypothetical protein